MWIQVKGHLQPDVNYRCIPEEEYDTLKASHTKLKKYAQHKDDCNLMSLIPCVKRNGRKISCTCGLDKALAEAEKL